MIHKPVILPGPGSLTVADHRHDQPRERLRFWGMVLLGLAFLSVLMVPQFRSTDPQALLVPGLTAALGAVFWVLAGRAEEKRVPLAHVSATEGLVRILPTASSQFQDVSREVWFDEVEDVLFGMTLFPVSPGSDVRVEAFTVCLRLFDGTILPVVEASLDKAAPFHVATVLSETLGVPVHQTGLGFDRTSEAATARAQSTVMTQV